MTIFVHTGGRESAGRPVTFLHGAGMDHSVWRYQTRWLAHRGWRVLAPDLPGHGNSPGEPPDSVEEGAGWLAGFLAQHDAPGAVVGHSLGALMAIEAAARHPGLIERLVLVGAGVRMPVHPVLRSAARDDLARAARFIAGWSLPPSHLGGHQEPGTWEMGTAIRLVERSRPGVLYTDLSASAGYDAAERLAEVTTEALIVSGRLDRMVGHEAVEELAEGLAGARRVVLPGAGHEPMLQQPTRFNRLLAEFLDGDGKGSSR